jgi:hypothetical protein
MIGKSRLPKLELGNLGLFWAAPLPYANRAFHRMEFATARTTLRHKEAVERRSLTLKSLIPRFLQDRHL